MNTPEALNFAASEPITAVDKHGKPVNDTEDFKVSKSALKCLLDVFLSILTIFICLF